MNRVSVLANPRFRIWFGKSQVVDGQGPPRIVYHGTWSDFEAFAPRRRNPELGFHFGSLAQAEFFAGYGFGANRLPFGCIMPVYLRIEKPLRIYDLFERGRGSAINLAHWLWRDGLLSRAVRDRIYAARRGREINARLLETLENMGFDGVIYPNEWEGGTAEKNEQSFAVFRPRQIKSVFNRGTFDPCSDSIIE